MRIILFALPLFLASQAAAFEFSVQIPTIADTQVERLAVTYDCSTTTLDVEYINADPISLVVFAYDGKPLLGSNLLSASGARYAGGQFIWWSKGRNASLYDLTKGEDAAPILECSEQY